MQASLPVFALRFQSSRAIIPNQIDIEIEAPRRQMNPRSVWPLDQSEAILSFVPAKLKHFAWVFQAVQVDVTRRHQLDRQKVIRAKIIHGVGGRERKRRLTIIGQHLVEVGRGNRQRLLPLHILAATGKWLAVWVLLIFIGLGLLADRKKQV